MPTTDIRCKSCNIRLFWADKDDLGEKLCFGCAQFEAEMMAEEEAVIEQGIRRWQEEAAEVMQMVKEEEHREP